MEVRNRPIIAVFVSGNGTTFRSTADAIHHNIVQYDIGLVITDHEDAGVLQLVDEVNELYGFNITTAVINRKRYPAGSQGRGQTREEAQTMLKLLKSRNIDHLALMGCLRIIAPQVIEEYGWKPEYAARDAKHQGMYLARMTNTHPGILPATLDTFGIRTQERVLELGLDETAHTFHVVATGVDTGPIIAENKVAVFAPSKYPDHFCDTPESLFARVQRIEKANLPLNLDMFLKRQSLFRA